ncbi:MAG: alpha/beta fold hydrolase [Actinobacteria bacterium]|nr:alpha/beta fold hydrolase [Actinomycetota bacterium]MSZ02203.1 alpha/beta fold hydrolase [Actinomycetota bacterium]
MSELIRPSTVLPANRRSFSFKTADGLNLIGEVSTPIGNRAASILCLHPLPTAGGMMDSHVYKKAANRLPAMADIEIIRFNTRGTTSEAGTSEGSFGEGVSEKFDVEAAIEYSFNALGVQTLWVMGWSFGTDLALKFARDPRVKGLILLSPPLRTSEVSDLEFWAKDGRPITALIPEFDDYLQPVAAAKAFQIISQIKLINVDEAKHLWVGEPAIYRVLSEITKIISPEKLPLPTEI